jgi:hypothetical protein
MAMSAFDRTLQLPYSRELVWDYLLAMVQQDQCHVIQIEAPRYLIVERHGNYQVYYLQICDLRETSLRAIVTTRSDVIEHLQQATDLDAALDGLVEKVPFPVWSGAEGRLDRLRQELWNDFHEQTTSDQPEAVPVNVQPDHQHFHYPHESKVKRPLNIPPTQFKHTRRKAMPGNK